MRAVLVMARLGAWVVVRTSAVRPTWSTACGATLRWRFRDRFIHDATVVRGLRGFATDTVRGRTERYRFTVPGKYKLYCSIHPVLMSQVVKVR